jgi:phage tail sheath protein FI
MAETLLSPGSFLTENDQSQIVQGPVQAGAALIGPTVVGPVNIPSIVTSYTQYKALFGAAFVSGGAAYEYLTSIAAQNYFNQGGNSLLVTRVASGSYTPANAALPSILSLVSGSAASASVSLTGTATNTGSLVLNGITFQLTASSPYPNTTNTVYVLNGATPTATWGNLTASINSPLSQSVYGYNMSVIGTSTYPNTNFSASVKGTSGNFYSIVSGSTTTYLSGGTDLASFTLETLSSGILMNNDYNTTTPGAIVNGALPSGSTSNIRWNVTSVNTGSGIFSITIRRGDDYENNKSVLETWNNLSLDPNQPNYIEYVIGNQKQVVSYDSTTGTYSVQLQGTYANKSNYVRVSSVSLPTINYFTATGAVSNPLFLAYLPQANSGSYQGSFTNATGAPYGSYGIEAVNFFENIPSVASSNSIPASNIQGLHPTDYDTAIGLLANGDAYKFNVVYAPGLTSQNASSEVSSLMTLAQTRGDNIAVVDMVGYGANLGTVTSLAVTYDNNYAATYWPWLQIRSSETGKTNFVPASVIIPAVYEYNDKISAEWFAPAGFTRGGLGTVLQPERKLTLNDRNSLYVAKVNPIGLFPSVGTVVYGQKTLQAKASALDRVNVRRLLIALKSYIKQISDGLVFEPNTQITRNKFLNAVNPYLETVQQRQGLYSFQVVMDDSNNTPDVVDRNQLVGAIYLQPTRTAEYISLTFNILPTGTSFA